MSAERNNDNVFYNAKQTFNNASQRQTNENRMRRQLFSGPTSAGPARPRRAWGPPPRRITNRASLLGNNRRNALQNANPVARQLLRDAPVLTSQAQVTNYDKLATATAAQVSLGLQETSANIRGNIANLQSAVAEIAKALKLNAKDAKDTLNMVRQNAYNKNFSKVSWKEVPAWLKYKMAVGWKTAIVKTATSPITIPYSIVKNAFVVPAFTGIKIMGSPVYKIYCLFMGVVVIYGTRVVVGMAFDNLDIKEFNQICDALPKTCVMAGTYLAPVRALVAAVWGQIGTQLMSNTERIRIVFAGVWTAVLAVLAKLKWVMRFTGY